MTASESPPLLEQILHAIEHDDIALPTLPEVAIKIQNLINDPNVSADQIVYVLSGDPFIAAQLIKVANSAAFADMPQVYRVRGAASRLGYRQLRNLVMTIAMNKMFCSNNPVVNKQMKAVWDHSRQVAAVSYVLASPHPHLSPDQAMLAGLIHDIGVLPLCLHIEQNHVPIAEDTLNELIRKCHATIGVKLLEKWNFPHDFIEVVGGHENLHRDSSDMPRADYTDVVCIANLQCSAQVKTVAWDKVAAAKRLGLSNEECQTFLERNAGRIALVAGMLGISATTEMQSSSIASPSASVNIPPSSLQPASAPAAAKKTHILSWFFSFWKK